MSIQDPISLCVTPSQDVQARRAEVRKYAGDPAYKKKVDEERRARKKAEVRPIATACID